MFNFISKLLFGKLDQAIDNAKFRRYLEADRQKSDFAKLNKKFQILLEEGSIEIVIKNVKGVIEHDNT